MAVTALADSFRAVITDAAAPCSAGTRPKITAVASVISAANTITPPFSSGVMSIGSGAGGTNRRARSLVHQANATPAAPPNSASRLLSVSICCTRRLRLAPSVRRTAVSRWRVAALASRRLATLAQAISSTTPATPSCTPITAVTAAPPMLGARHNSYSFTPLPASSA